MIIVYRYQLNKVILPTFRGIIEKEGQTEFNIIDTEVIRNRTANPTSEIDRKIKYHINNGLLISDVFLIESLMQNWDNKNRNILVGFPRNIEQLNTLNYHLNKLNDNIERIIYYKINDFDEIYDIAQTKYGKLYDSDMKEHEIENMRNHKNRTEEIIEKVKDVSVLEIDFLNEDTNCLLY